MFLQELDASTPLHPELVAVRSPYVRVNLDPKITESLFKGSSKSQLGVILLPPVQSTLQNTVK